MIPVEDPKEMLRARWLLRARWQEDPKEKLRER